MNGVPCDGSIVLGYRCSVFRLGVGRNRGCQLLHGGCKLGDYLKVQAVESHSLGSHFQRVLPHVQCDASFGEGYGPGGKGQGDACGFKYKIACLTCSNGNAACGCHRQDGGHTRYRKREKTGVVAEFRGYDAASDATESCAESACKSEHADGQVKKITHELLTIAARLGEPSAVVVGSPGSTQALSAELASYGAAKIYAAENDELAGYLVAPVAEVLAVLVTQVAPAAMLLAKGYRTRDKKRHSNRFIVVRRDGRPMKNK